MTLSTTTNKVTLGGNGSTTVFPYGFIIPDASDVVVVYTSSTGVQTLLGSSQYTITGIGNSTGGTVTYPLSGSPIVSGSTLTIMRQVALVQGTSFANQGPMLPSSIEQAEDYDRMVDQQIEEQIGRAISVPVGDANPPPLPSSTLRAGKYLGFDGSGNPTALPAPQYAVVTTTTVDFPSRAAAIAANIPSTVAFCRLNGYTTPGDAPLATYYRLGSTPSPVLAGNFQSADGGWWAMSRADVIYVEQFGGSVTSSDNTAATNNAITWISSAYGGGTLGFGGVGYTFLGTISIPYSDIRLSGSSRFGSVLNFANGALDCILAQGALHASIGGLTIDNLTINGSSKTGGRALAIQFAYRTTLRDLNVTNSYTGFEIYNCNDVFTENIIFQLIPGGSGTNFSSFGPSGQAPTACYGIFWHGAVDGSASSVQLTTFNVTVSAQYSGADGFVWDGDASTWNMDQTTALNCRYGLWVKNTAESNSHYPTFLSANNFNTDGMHAAGLRIDGGATFLFSNCVIGNTSAVGAPDTNAVQIFADVPYSYTREVYFTNCRIGLCRQSAAYVEARDVQFSNCTFVDGGSTTSGIYPGLQLAAPATYVVVSGCKFSLYGAPNTWKYGIQVDYGTLDILLMGSNIFSNNLTAPVLWNNVDANSRNDIVSGSYRSVDMGPFINPKSDNVTGGSITLSADRLVNGVYMASGTPSAPFSVTTASAAAIIAALDIVSDGKGIACLIINATGQTMTVLPGSGVSVIGVLTTGPGFAIASGASRQLMLRIANPRVGYESIAIYG